jgi:restriction endonuclease S subunit
MQWISHRLADICDISKGLGSAQNELPGDYPLVVTAEHRKSSSTYQFDGEAVCIPLVSSTGHGNASINRVHYQSGKFSVASILAAVVPKDSLVVDARFLYYYFTEHKNSVLVPLMKGTSNVSLTIKSLSEAQVVLPPIEFQKKIAAQLDRASGLVVDWQNSIKLAEAESRDLLFSLFEQTIQKATYRKIFEVAPLIRRPVEVSINGIYSELGVRSFGKGTFHKPALPGIEVGSKKLFRIVEGDLLFNIVFAWEGAVAVAQRKDEGRVGSHRFLTCVPNAEVISAEFINFYFSTPEGLNKLVEASPGGAGRNRTLGVNKLASIEIPVPLLECQQRFLSLKSKLEKVKLIRLNSNTGVQSLMPALLHKVFRPVAVELMRLSENNKLVVNHERGAKSKRTVNFG